VSAQKICPQCGTEYELDQRFCPKDGSTLKMQGAGAADIVGDVIAERYHVLKKLGEGGMGTVYLAEHVKMGRKSAVKIMNPGMVNDADAIQRFNREATNASKITHTNVAAIYDFGETKDGLIYLAMEFIEGESLTSLIEKNGALPAQRAANIAQQTAEGLVVAHDMGIVHRDLKPDNIMIAKNRDGSDCVKVVDFGIAKATENTNQKVTKTGLVVGTPEYMSPEQLAGDKLDGRSDIYSLGLVTFNMLTGKLPFPSETVQESMIMRLTDRPRTLTEMTGQAHWPQQLQDVLDKALSRDAAERYQNAGQFGRDLVKAVDAMPASALSAGGTLVLGATSVPATRVSSAAKTKAMAAPPKSAPPPPAPAKKSNVPLMAGGGLVAAGLIGFLAFTMWKPDVTSATDKVQPTSQDSAAGAASGVVTAPIDSGSAKEPGVTPPRPTPVRNAATETKTAPAVDASKLLARWKTYTDDVDAAKAELVLREVPANLPKFRTNEDSVGALYYLSQAHGNLDHDQAVICGIINEIKSRALLTRYASVVTPIAQSC
jgi:serine/threonine protein kinase